MKLESLACEWHYEIEPQLGRLHAQLSHVHLKSPEKREILRLSLTARGPIASSGEKSLSLGEGLDLGHEAIVKAFWEMTSERAHEYWGYYNDAT